MTWFCAFAQMDNHPIKQVVVGVLGLFGTLWIHIFGNKLSEIERFRKIYMFVQFLSAPVKSEQLDHQNSRSLHYRKSFSRFLFLLTSFTLIFVVSRQSFDFAELLNALFKVLVMRNIERKGEKSFIFVWFAVTRQTLHLRSQLASKNLKYQRLFFKLLDQRRVQAQRRFDDWLEKHHNKFMCVFLSTCSVLFPKLFDIVLQLPNFVRKNLFAWRRHVNCH